MAYPGYCTGKVRVIALVLAISSTREAVSDVRKGPLLLDIPVFKAQNHRIIGAEFARAKIEIAAREPSNCNKLLIIRSHEI